MSEIRKTLIVCLCIASVAGSRSAAAAELQARTSQAYETYLEAAERAFISRVRAGSDPSGPGRTGTISAGPGGQDGIITVPGGLVHHWIGRTLLRGVTLEHVVRVSASYGTYSTVYKAIVASKVLGQEGDTYRVLMRLKESEAGITAVLDVRSTIQYVELDGGVVYAVSHADEIREVERLGRPDERLLPPGRDNGYLWRASTFTHFRREGDGVYVEMETFGLSRRFPPMLGWIIEPIARRVGRRSVQTSLEEFSAAVRRMRVDAEALAGKPSMHLWRRS
jgi:hypothetical protein